MDSLRPWGRTFGNHWLEDFVSPPEEKCTIILWTENARPMRPLLTRYTLSSKFFFLSFFFFCLVTKYMRARDDSAEETTTTTSVSVPEEPKGDQGTFSMSADSRLPNKWLNSPKKKKNPFHVTTQLEVQLWTVPLSSLLAVYRLPLDFLMHISNISIAFLFFFFPKVNLSKSSRYIKKKKNDQKKRNQYQIVLVLLLIQRLPDIH